MEERVSRISIMCSFRLIYLCLAAAAACSSIHCGDARREGSDQNVLMASAHSGNSQAELNGLMKILLDMVRPLDLDSPPSSNTQPYGVSSPFSLPPYDSLAPIPLPQNTPPFCVYPPLITSQPPPPISFSPSFPFPNPPPTPAGAVPSPPESIPAPAPPSFVFPGPPQYVPSPPLYSPGPPSYVPSPPLYSPGPPSYVPSPPLYYSPSPPSYYVPSPPSSSIVPSPPVFLPPVVYPPPAVPPPPYTAPASSLWCVAKPSVPGPIIEEAMNYACGSGADCDEIQPSGSCFEPNTLVAHASYAFNSYWQKTKVSGGSCEFGGIAMLVTVDPSYDGCHFMYS